MKRGERRRGKRENTRGTERKKEKLERHASMSLSFTADSATIQWPFYMELFWA